jgi:beta-galactosidase
MKTVAFKLSTTRGFSVKKYQNLFSSVRKYAPVTILLLTSSLYAATLTSFKPGKDWMDVDGKKIDCHAGNIIYQAATKTYFWFGEHRGTPSGVSCYSSQDLYNWKNRGVALDKTKTAELKSGIIERPKVAYNEKTKKYVMWFHYDNSNYGLAHQGVAVCDSAPGPYTFLNHFQPNGHQSRDIGMFPDADGKVYIGYAANNGSSINAEVRMVELSEDYLSVTTNDAITGAHCEGPAVLKWNNLYYLLTSQCKGWTPNPASYYTCSKVVGTYSSGKDPCINDTKKTTFDSQPSSIFKVPGLTNGFIYIGDRWNGGGSTNSQNVFLPIKMTDKGEMQLKWYDEWKLDVFGPTTDVKKPENAFKSLMYTNIINQSGLHAYDLLGRDIESALKYVSADRKIVNINRSTTENVASNGMYIVR